jgi:aspartate racemase
MTQKTLGVVGGLGIETGMRFCSNVANAVRRATKKQPSIICHVVDIPVSLEEDLIRGRTSQEHLSILINSIRSLDAAGVHGIAVPCNTVHVFLDQMQNSTSVPVFSIIEETVEEITRKGIERAGILASSTTIDNGLYSKELSRHGIEPIVPKGKQQEKVGDIISRILDGSVSHADEGVATEIIKRLEIDGAEAIILGCTDLRLLEIRSAVPVIDSTEALEKASVEFFLNPD